MVYNKATKLLEAPMNPTDFDFDTGETFAVHQAAPAAQIHTRWSVYEVARISSYRKNAAGEYVSGEGCRVKLAPISGEPFGSGTPAGTMEMVIVNPAAAAVFLQTPIGQQYDVLFTPVQQGE
jgi:hypothetical protein